MLLRRFHLKCSNLARGESMKDPVGHLRIPAGFFIGAICDAAKVPTPCDASWPTAAWNHRRPSGISLPGGSFMPPWMELLLNVIGYAGFIAVAKYHKPSDGGGDEPLSDGAPSASSPCA